MVLWVTSAMFASPALALNVRVESIRINDQAVDQAPAVIVISAQVPQGERRTLRKEDVFAAGFELVAPAMTLIVLRSDNGNRILLEPGARLRVADITATGERYLLRRGSILFEVVRALSFFNVEFEEKFVAQVRGTRFRVTGKEDGTFTCEVLEGRLVVQRPENIRLGRAERTVSATTPVALDQNGKRIAQWTEVDIAATRSFADLKDAQRYLTEKTEQARSDSLERALVLGALFAEGGKQSMALATYTQAEEDLPRETPGSPQLAELYMGKAQLLARMNRAQEALAYYDLARRVYGLRLNNGGYVQLTGLVSRFLGVLVRAEMRDAFVFLGDPTLAEGAERLYVTKSWRLTAGLRFPINQFIVGKAEYLHNGEYGGVPTIANDVFTTSLVMSWGK